MTENNNIDPSYDPAKVTLTDGSLVTKDHKEIDPATGMQKGYVVLSEAERAKGFVRPVYRSYKHVGSPGPKYELVDLTEQQKESTKGNQYVKYEKYPESESPIVGRYWTQRDLDRAGKACNGITTMSLPLSETYACDPHFYGGTMCSHCHNHFPVGKDGEFVWVDSNGDVTDLRVGT